jgi:hypothetical protein
VRAATVIRNSREDKGGEYGDDSDFHGSTFVFIGMRVYPLPNGTISQRSLDFSIFMATTNPSMSKDSGFPNVLNNAMSRLYDFTNSALASLFILTRRRMMRIA